MHLSTKFGKEIQEKKSPGTNGLTLLLLPALDFISRKERLHTIINPVNYPVGGETGFIQLIR